MTDPRTAGRRKLRMRLAAVALAGAAAATGAVVTAAPAQAVYVDCTGATPAAPVCSITVEREFLLPPRECVCELKLDWSVLDRVRLPEIGDLVNEGVHHYRTAGRTADPAVRARLELAGSELFTRAVRLASVPPSMKPQPQPWSQAAGSDLVTGLDSVFRAERTRDPVLAAALRQRAAVAFQSFGAR